MYKPIKSGTEINIYGYDIQVPPLGYGRNISTGKVEKTDIIKRSTKKEEQYWERTPLPKDWAKLRRAEAIMQLKDEDYEDPEISRFISQEWRRRLCGVWVYINGVPTYLTGLHYFYINWWQIDIGYPEYRNPDRKFFYVLVYCMEDPRCCGLLEGTKRRQGKTYRGGCLLYEVISRTVNVEGGTQSKTATDARDVVFKKAIISPFKKLPDFFIPIFDKSKGVTPTSELKFAHTTKKGKGALDDLDKPELNSLIDWASSGKFAYDGRKKKIIFEDEVGKTEEEDVYERHSVTRYCLETDGEWTGFTLKSTTVEEMESGGGPFLKLWQDSDCNDRDANEHTKTGMYRFMTPAYETLYYDKYGMPDEDKARQYFLNRRAGQANNPHALSGEIRKNPFNEDEMFRIDGEKCLFNPELLNAQRDWLSWNKDVVRRYDLSWKDDIECGEVVRKENNTNGKFWMPVAFKLEQANKVEKRNDRYFPKNNHSFRAACDPFKYNKTKDQRRSDCAAFVGMMMDPAFPSSPFGNARVCRYRHRAPTTGMSNDDILKMCFYFGCGCLFERNVDHWKEYFYARGCGAFLIVLDGEDEPGIYSDGQGNMLQTICNLIESDIEENSKKILFKPLIEEYLEFDVGNTTKFDETIASGLMLVAMKKKQYKKTNTIDNDVSRYFKRYKVNQ